MARRLTVFSKFLITLLILASIVFGGRYLLYNTDFGRNLLEEAGQAVPDAKDGETRTNESPRKGAADDDDIIKVQMFTWGGYAPGLYFNEGAEFSKRSRFWQEYGIKVQFELIDDFVASREAWKADQVHLLGNETSAMNTEMEGLAKFKPRILLQCDWSRGGDAVVVRREIKSVNDLKGKKVAFAGFTPSVTFLNYMLESAGMDFDDVEIVETVQPTDAANAFIAGEVAAAVVWSPDDERCVRQVPGAYVLQSTREASNIIADVYIVKDDYLRANKDKLQKFYEGWMEAVAEIKNTPSNRQKAARIFSEVTGIPETDAEATIGNVYLTTHGDNLNFFGLNPDFRGMTGEELYTEMGSVFEGLEYAPSDRPIWRMVSYPQITQAAELPADEPGYRAEGQKDFQPAPESLKEKQAISSKPVTINFNTGAHELTENAKTIIDLQFADVAKSYANTRIRIEGNTDSRGARNMNLELSRKRAQAVADYLQKAYGMDPDRFIIVGNGPDEPVPGCESNATEECRARNRRTDFQLVSE